MKSCVQLYYTKRVREMKRIIALCSALLLCAAFAVTVFADNIYIVDDENDFVPPQTTTAPTTSVPTTTASSIGSIIDRDTIDAYLGGFADKIGNGIDSLLSGFEQWGGGTTTTTQLQPVVGDQHGVPSFGSTGGNTQPQQSVVTTDSSASSEEVTTSEEKKNDSEVASVLIVQQAGDQSAGISGSTLTLVMFIAAVIVLILVVAVVLVVMTRRTEFNSAVMNRSTLPSVNRPDNLASLMDDDIGNDGTDYGNIAYWDSSDFK